MSKKERSMPEWREADYFFLEPAAACVRGAKLRGEAVELPERFLTPPLEGLTAEEKGEIVRIGWDAGLHLKKFKRDFATMPRVRRSLGILHAFAPESLLDIGSGRGNFLWSCLNEFPWVPVTTLEFSRRRFELHETVRQGGLSRLTPVFGDVQNIGPETFGGKTFDIVTIFEVLEHLPDPGAAIRAILPLARRGLILSVPSKEDDNPEHIHLFNEEKLLGIFRDNGIASVRFDYVPGHLFAIVTQPS